MAEQTKGIPENFQPINVNEIASVKLSSAGHEVYRRHYGALIFDRLRTVTKIPPELNIDENGNAKFQLWELMNIFGPSYEPSRPPFQENKVTIDRPEQKPHTLTLEDPIYVNLTEGKSRLGMTKNSQSEPLTELSLGTIGKLFGNEFSIGNTSPSIGINIYIKDQ